MSEHCTVLLLFAVTSVMTAPKTICELQTELATFEPRVNGIQCHVQKNFLQLRNE